MRLFDVPKTAVGSRDEPPFPMGGIGCGHFVCDDAGTFRDWNLQPGPQTADQSSPFDRFHGWWARRGGSSCVGLAGPVVAEQSRLFPLTWTRYDLDPGSEAAAAPLLESVSFSPLLPGDGFERSLPIHIVAFRAHNPGPVEIEMALMLTWECGWPEPISDADYDLQHDNLCLTGSLGSPGSANRQGIAVPDLHYEGIYLQGIEPWVVPGEWEELIDDFAEDGELDPRVARSVPRGAAAWLKFTLAPDETKEAPFVIVWHFPFYEGGPAKGLPRYYTQFLGRQRPDNAIVWLAEQAVQHYGGEVANYRYWLQRIRDWQDGCGRGAALNGLAELMRGDVSWTEERGLEVTGIRDPARRTVLDALAGAAWPDLSWK